MVFLTDAFPGCPSSMINIKPTSVNIVDSTFHYNTAHKSGGGLAISFDYFCCSAEVNITNVTFLNNTVSKVSYGVNGTELFKLGGNIYIDDSSGQWFNNSVRIRRCLIKGSSMSHSKGIPRIFHPHLLQFILSSSLMIILYSTLCILLQLHCSQSNH